MGGGTYSSKNPKKFPTSDKEKLRKSRLTPYKQLPHTLPVLMYCSIFSFNTNFGYPAVFDFTAIILTFGYCNSFNSLDTGPNEYGLSLPGPKAR